MDHFEMVEKLRTKANVSYEEAKAALEKSDWDMLDALVLLESEGKVNGAPEAKEYTTQEKKEYSWNTGSGEVKVTFYSALSKRWDWIKKLFQKGNANQFVITRKGDELIAMPITVLALLLICFWPFSLIVLFVGLFLGARYSFRGPDINTNVNAFMNKAQDKAASAVEIHVEKTESKTAESESPADEGESKVE